MSYHSEDAQSHFSARGGDLDGSLRKQIDDVTRVIVLQRRARSTNAFRLAVLEYSKGDPYRRTASMPGMTVELMPNCGGSLDVIAKRCRLVADRVVWAHNATLLTKDHRGFPHCLRIALTGGEPIQSTGLVPEGDWANVPSGETFMLPGLAYGSVVITGSVLDYPIPDGEELVLHLNGDRLAKPPAGIGSVVERAHALLMTPEGKEADPNSSMFAELGIGVNDRIQHLTGLPLLDEKQFGTVHLGFGSNRQFRGPIRSPVHNDLVLDQCELFLDHSLAVSANRLQLTEAMVFPHYLEVPLHYTTMSSVFTRCGNFTTPTKHSRFLAARQWTAERAPEPLETQLGDQETSILLSKLLSKLPSAPVPFTMGNALGDFRQFVQLDGNPSVTPEGFHHLMELLFRFRLIQHHV